MVIYTIFYILNNELKFDFTPSLAGEGRVRRIKSSIYIPPHSGLLPLEKELKHLYRYLC
jgi:hypothetical protein